MNFKIITLIPLIISFSASAEREQSCERTKTYLDTYKEQSYPTTKHTVAAISIGVGTYLLQDAIITAHDMQDQDQQNGGKGIALSTIIATGFITAGSYLLKQVWDEKNTESKNQEFNPQRNVGDPTYAKLR